MMKIPKLFLPEKSFDKKIEDLMSKEDKQPEHEGFDEELVLKINEYLKEETKNKPLNPVLCIVDDEDRAFQLDLLVCRLATHAKGWVTFLSNYESQVPGDFVGTVHNAQQDHSRKVIIYLRPDTMDGLKRHEETLCRLRVLYAKPT